MTACIYYGPPGSYKTFSVVQDVIIPALLEGRVVVTNIRGLDDIDHVESQYNKAIRSKKYVEFPETAEIQTVPHDKEGFETIGRFFHWAPKGALIVMDEGQRVYPTRLRTLSGYDYPGGEEAAEEAGRPATLENAFDQHRHHNWDIYLTTPNIAKIHREIRNICEYAYKHRDISGVFPWYKNKYKVIKHDPDKSGSSETHAIGGIQFKKANRRFFSVYQSTATGIAKDSNEDKSILKNPKFLLFCGIILAAFSLFAYTFTGILSRGDKADDVAIPSVTGQAPSLSRDTRDNVQSLQVGNVLAQLVSNNKMTFAGSLENEEKSLYAYKLQDMDTEKSVLIYAEDLQALGIEIVRSGCVHVLKHANFSYTVTCNPSITNVAHGGFPRTEAMRGFAESDTGSRAVVIRHEPERRQSTSGSRLN